MRRPFFLAGLAAVAFMNLGSDCHGGGGGPQCPTRNGETDVASSDEDAPDAGPGLPDDSPTNASTNTGGSTGGGPDNCPRE